MLVIETRISAIQFANILHFLKEKHQITPTSNSEALRFAISLLSELTPDIFSDDEERALEYIRSLLGGKLGREERMAKASKEVADESGKVMNSAIVDAVRNKMKEK